MIKRFLLALVAINTPCTPREPKNRSASTTEF